jgi:acyl carrier protein
MEDILEKIKALYADNFGGDADVVEASTRFDELELDSLDRIDLLSMIEDKFDLELPDAEMSKITTLQELATYVHDHASV